MEKQHEYLQQLLELTEKIWGKAKTIGSKMEDNGAEDLVELQSFFDQRQAVIDELDKLKNGAVFNWSPEGKAMATKLQETEKQLNPLMKDLHQAFTEQINRISQTKQMSMKYKNPYQNATADGAFFDTRK